ncbi:MAG TPA: GNAT family N-acetyltransferase [Dongiaceae bacterium]
MEDLSIRPAVASDTDDLRRGLIALQEYESALHDSRLPAAAVADPYLNWMLRQIAEQDGLCLVGRLADDFFGFAAGWIERANNLTETEDSTAFGYISDICILPAWRGRRLSAPLLVGIERHFHARSVRRLRISSLDTNVAALAAYRSAGYSPYEITLEKVLKATASTYP